MKKNQTKKFLEKHQRKNKMDIDLGRLIKTVNETCPEDKKHLQLREIEGKEYLICPLCGFEKRFESKKRKHQEKVSLIEEASFDYDRHYERRRIEKGNGGSNQRSFRNNRQKAV